jgi:hypothetical protein
MLLAAMGVALIAVAAHAQNVEVVLKEDALNRLVDRLRDPSDSGLHQPALPTRQPDTYTECKHFGEIRCPGKAPDGSEQVVPMVICKKKDGGSILVPSNPPVAWQWWITGSRFQAKSGSLTFTAKLRSRIGTRWRSEERTVPASVSFDAGASLLRVQVSSFKVPVRYEANGLMQTVADVDVGKLSSFAMRVGQPKADLAAPGGARTLTARAASGTATYEPGRVRVKFDTVVNGVTLAAPPAWNIGNPGLEDGRIGIQESLLNEMATALGPLSYQQTITVPLPVPNPFFPLGPPFFIVNVPCNVAANVTNVRFDVDADPAPIAVSGQVVGSMCGLFPFGGPISTTANVIHNATSRTLRITTAATSFRPTVAGITLPFTVNIGTALSVPPIPFRGTLLELDTMVGPLVLRLSGQDVALSKRNGIIEVRGNVALR